MIVQHEQLSKLLSAPKTPEKLHPASTLEVVVMFTDVPGTLKALKTAAGLMAPQVVPYPLPLESPPVSKKFSQMRFQTLASHGPIDTHVELYFCRDRDEAVCQALEPEDIIVIGARRSWWPTAEKALARKLQRKGHHVILVDSGRSK
jgi:hypothetical protein